MRALRITPDEVQEIEIDVDYRDIQAAIGCDLFCQAGRPAEDHMAWVDDIGALTVREGTQITLPYWRDDQLFGPIVITGIDDEGNTAPATLDADWIRSTTFAGRLTDIDGTLTAVVRPFSLEAAHDDEEDA